MNSKIISQICIFLLIELTTVSAQDNWNKWSPEDGVPIRQSWDIEWFSSGASRTDGELPGEVAFVWTDTRSSNRNIFLQVIDNQGDPKFQENGITIISPPGYVENLVIQASDDGGWFIAWIDRRNDRYGDLYCSKVNSDGETVWGDDNAGIPVRVVAGQHYNTSITDDLEGGCLITWSERGERERLALYAAHVFCNGRHDQNWDENGEQIVDEIPANDYSGPNYGVTTDSEGGIILSWLVWSEERYNINAMRVSAAGERIWRGEGGVRISNNDVYPDPLQICTDGNGGAFFSWIRWEREKIVAVQRINSDGQLMWGEFGVDLTESADDWQWPSSMTAGQPGEAIVTWNESGYLKSMLISGEDEPVLEWNPESGVNIGDHISCRSSDIIADTEGGAYLGWWNTRDDEGHRRYHLTAQKLSPEGELLWGDDGIDVTERMVSPQLEIWGITPAMLISDNSCIYAWVTGVFNVEKIEAQRLSPEGRFLYENDFNLVEDPYPEILIKPLLLSKRDGEFALIWLDRKVGEIEYSPHVQFCRDNGDEVEIQFADGGIPVVEGVEGSYLRFNVNIDDDGSTIVVWSNAIEDQTTTIYAQKLTAEGEIAWEENGVRCGETNEMYTCLGICNDGQDGVFIVWSGDEIQAQHLNRNGERLWGNEGILVISEEHNPFFLRSIIGNTEGGMIILWRASRHNLYATNVGSNGEFVWGADEAGLIRLTEDGTYSNMVRHPDGFLFTWMTNRSDDEDKLYSDLYGQFLENDGTFRWNENGVLLTVREGGKGASEIAVDNDDYIWILSESSDEASKRIYIQKLNPDVQQNANPELIFGQNGRMFLSREVWGKYNFDMVHDGHNGVYIVWDDEIVWNDANIYATHLDPDGQPYEEWDQEGNLVCGASGDQGDPQAKLLKEDGETGIVVSWIDERSSTANIYCQRVDDNRFNSVGNIDGYSEAPTDFEMTCIYPNPFNSTTTIRYSLSSSSQVSLQVYNLSGQLINKLFEGYKKAGIHSTNLNANNLPSGLYFIRLKASEQVFTQKVILIR
ncbi:MAG: T9SS type A sorting domain-containing protein [Candidatus Hatepunaea meridiana]|nr:T9SS type A sorting domain-containing protein [Candidatus Hatepunaea meridiana]